MSEENRTAELGVAQLTALLQSDLLDDKEKLFVEAALDTVYEDPEEELDKLGDDAEVVVEQLDEQDLPDMPTADVPLEQGPQDRSGADG